MSKHHPSVTRICKRCKKQFLEQPARIKLGKGKFCSLVCYRGTPAQQFWSKVKKTPTCWLWTGSTLPRGYGHIRRKGKSGYAHRLSYELHFGKIEPGIYVLHRCDNPRCVRPSHLFKGTAGDNIHDCMAKGRWRFVTPPKQSSTRRRT